MSDEIKQGDPVMTVRGMPCCGLFPTNQIIGTVVKVKSVTALCGGCYRSSTVMVACLDYDLGERDGGRPLSMLKKINQPDESEFIRHSEELTA